MKKGRKNGRMHMRSAELIKNRNEFTGNISRLSESINTQIKRYARNLIGGVKLTEESLYFFFSVLHPNKLKQLLTVLTDILPDKEEEKKRYGRDDTVDRIIDQITELPKDFPPHICGTLEKRITTEINGCFQEIIPEYKLPRNLIKLTSQFELNDIEREIVLFFSVLPNAQVFTDLFDKFEGSGKLTFIARAAGIQEKAVRRALGKDEKLISMKLISESINRMRYGSFPEYELSEPVSNFIHGFDSAAFRKEIIREDKKKAFPIKAFILQEDQISTMEALLSGPGPCNILFYGRPGTGKTELARALCRESGKKCYFLQSGAGGSRENRRPFHSGGETDRGVLLQLAINLMEAHESVLVVDEADEILNTGDMFSMLFGISSSGGNDKGLLNTALDSHNKKIIWITNRISGIDDSVLRRFSYSRHFVKNSAGQRLIYWNSLIKKHRLTAVLPAETRKELAAEYKINAGHIGRALETFAQLPGKEADISRLKDILDTQNELINYGRKTKKKTLITGPQFNPAYLHTDIPVDRVLTALRGRCRGHILLHGVPGTGKTEFARHIAESLDRELILKRSSDILSKWVGENEQNIRDAFAEAEADGAVLCIDEADSFFKNRESARSSWEVSFTNELLTQMESFSGIFVCSTNLIDILDPAVMRRFAWKIEFLPLRKEHRTEIVQTYFQFRDPADNDSGTFADIPDLTPGDVKAVWLKYGTSPSLSPAEIAEELKRETGYRQTGSGEIGFRE
jgi:transitional endoplasmic reticulum ATPase